MLRISIADRNGQSSLLKLEGQLIGPWVDELRGACEGICRNGHSLTLDLGEVTFADRQGVALLVDLRLRRVHLLSCSPFLQAQLNSALDA